jgi:DNA mismatch repair protein MutS2
LPTPPLIQSETLDLLEWPRLCRHLATFTATNIGTVAAQRLNIPTTQAESEELLAQTLEAAQLESSLGGLQFGGIRDIGVALERAQVQSILSGEELLDIATTLFGARRLRRQIDAQEDLPVLQALVADLRTFPELEQEIHRCIDERGQVADRASDKLAGLRQQLKVVRDRIYTKLQRIIQRQGGALQETLITQRGDRFVIPVKAAQKEAVPGIVHDVSTSGATLYVEPHSVVENGNKRRALQKEEDLEAEAIRQQLTYQVAAVLPDLEHLVITLVRLDLAAARARYGLWLEGNAPRFVEGEQITLRQLKHPLLLWQQKKEQRAAGITSEVVPIDLVIRPDLRVVAITGPNTGGKTVTLKTLGLIALMAKSGMFIPAREPVELPWFDAVLADIGDEQSIEQSLSTFSGHVKRIGRILDEIEDQTHSLVLLDEVGAGTDPSEGSALAIALLKHLADRTRLTVATTHYGELKALKYEDDRFENASVEFDDVQLAPTYRLLWGIPGRSNALSIARRLGLKESVLEQAKARMGGANEDVNQIIEGLETQRKRQEARAAEAEKLVAKAEKFYQEVEARAQRLRDREQTMRRQQEKDIETALLHARAEIAKVIRELQQGGKTAKDAQKATELLDQISEKRLGSHPAKVKSADKSRGYRPKIGDRVRLSSLGGQTVEVMDEADDDGKIAVRFGIMKMTVDLSDIESLKGEKAELVEPSSKSAQKAAQPIAYSQPAAPAVKTERNTVDLRGMRVSEAESVLEEAIAHANGPLWLIHGHGTGKLRQGVHEYLKRHPQVQSFAAAEQVEGGKGVTVAMI